MGRLANLGPELSFLDGVQTAKLALRLLESEDARTIPPLMNTSPSFRVDPRQLDRWGLSDRNLLQAASRRPYHQQSHAQLARAPDLGRYPSFVENIDASALT